VFNCSRCSCYIIIIFLVPIKLLLNYKLVMVSSRSPLTLIALSRPRKFSRCRHCDLLTFGYRCRLHPGIRHSSRKMHGGPDYSPFKLTPVAGSNKDGHSKASGRNPVNISRRRFMIDYYKLFSILLMHCVLMHYVIVSRIETRRILSACNTQEMGL